MNEKYKPYKPSEKEIIEAESHLKADKELMKESKKREQRAILHEKIDRLIYENPTAYDANIKLVIKFQKELERKGYNPMEYKLWHVIVNSTTENKALPYDTPENDLENFILGLKE